MKKSDYALIVLIAGGSLLVSYFTVNSLPIFQDIGKPVTVKVAKPIEATVDDLDKRVFNEQAINPTVEIYISNQNKAFDGAGETDQDTPQGTNE